MNGQGQGESTPRKEDGFAKVFRQSLYLSAVLSQYIYWHIDLNAGSGFNDAAECDGSPVVFLREATQVGRKFRAFFYDNNPDAIEQLRPRVSTWIQVTDDAQASVHCLDNDLALDQVAAVIEQEERNPHYAFGTCVCDPNGFPGGFPLEALATFSRRFPRIDLVFNLNVSLFARFRGVKRSGDPRVPHFATFSSYPTLEELLSHFPSRNWWVRNIPPRRAFKGEQFTILFGRSRDDDRRTFADFFRLNSPEGQYVVNTLKRNHGGFLPFREFEEMP